MKAQSMLINSVKTRECHDHNSLKKLKQNKTNIQKNKKHKTMFCVKFNGFVP